MTTEIMKVANVPTKQEVADATEQIVSQVESGAINPLFALGVLTAYEKAVSDAKKSLLGICIAEAEKMSEKSIIVGGATFQLKESGVRYDFSTDREWNDINNELEEKKAMLKGRETVLRQLGYCSKFSTPTVAVTLAK